METTIGSYLVAVMEEGWVVLFLLCASIDQEMLFRLKKGRIYIGTIVQGVA